jgi:ribosome-associated translation inhibitor RaiA
VDEAAEKLSKQILKVKEKLQHHKKFERSKEAKWGRVNSKLEYNNAPFPPKKSA